MSRLIAKNCCIILLFVLIGNNNFFAQTTTKSTAVKPIVALAGKSSGKLNISILKEIKSLDVIASIKIVEFTIVINDSTSGKGLSYYVIKNNDFSKEMLKEIESRKNGFTLILDEIKVRDENGQIRKLPPEVFHVVTDK